jgi:hypothetical protein
VPDDGRVASAPPTATHEVVVRCFTDEFDVLSGCRLELEPVRTSTAERVRLPMRETAPGTHTIEVAHAGDYSVRCRSPYFGEPLVNISVGAEPQVLDLRLAPRADLCGGAVRGESGESIQGVFLEAGGSSAREAYCETDGDGRFLFRRVDASATALRVALRDRFGAAGVVDDVAPRALGWGRLDHELTAAARGALHVTLSGDAGQSLDFDVVATASYGPVRTARRASSKAGHAWVANVPQGNVLVQVVPGANWLPVERSVAVGPDGEGRVDLTTRRAAPLQVDVASAGGALPELGVLATLTRQAANGADAAAGRGLAVRSTRESGVAPVVRPVRHGSVEFGCDPAASYTLEVVAPGHSPCRAVVRAEANGTFARLDVQLQPHGMLRGRVEPPEGVAWLARYSRQRAGGAATGSLMLVQLDRPERGRRQVLRVSPAPDGTFAFSGLSAGTWQLRLACPVGAAILGDVELGERRVVHHDPIDLGHLRPGTVEGHTLIDRTDCTVHAVSAFCADGVFEVPVRSDGRFELLAPGGSYTLRFAVGTPDGAVDVTRAVPVVVQAGQDQRVVTRIALRRVQLTVVDDATGSPLPGVVLSIDEHRAGSYGPLTTDAAGTVTVFPCPVGEFGVSIKDDQASGWRTVWRTVARVSADADDAVEIRVTR